MEFMRFFFRRVEGTWNDVNFFIFTLPNYREVIQMRSSNFDAAFKKASESILLQYIVNQIIKMLKVNIDSIHEMSYKKKES